MIKKLVILVFLSLLLGVTCSFIGLAREQALAMSIFSFSIVGTLFFWDFRLSFVFIGSGLLFLTRSVDLENFIKFASL